MWLTLTPVLALSLLSCPVLGANLYVSHYSGTVSTLELSRSGSNYTLTETSSVSACGVMPSWLSWDSTSRTLYCTDENFFGSAVGSSTAFSAGDDGSLSETVNVTDIGGGVASALYGGDDGNGFIAIAHYQYSKVTTFKLPLTSSSTAQQTFEYKLSQPGPNPSRQDVPHPHHVVVDPTGTFLMVVDLGADLLRIYSIDQSSGKLTECPNVSTTPGNGPRHARFWTPGSSAAKRQNEGTKVFVANELANVVTAYSVSYANACPSITQEQVITPYANNKTAPEGTGLGEVQVKDNFLYVTDRNDQSFAPNDSITQFSISPSGSLTFEALTSAYGTYPRTFVINKKGDLAAIGDQTTSNIAIVQRNTTSGKLGSKVAELRVGPAGHPGSEDGLSSVVWAS